MPGYTCSMCEPMPAMTQSNDATEPAPGDDRSSWPVWVGRVGDPQPKADYSMLTPSQRIALCWEVTEHAWTLSGRDLNESAFRRDSESLSRRAG